MGDLTWTQQGVHFVCDKEKRLANIKKHKIDLVRAGAVFFDPLGLTDFDREHSDQEDRYRRIGLMENGKLILAVFTFRNETIRLISARNAEKGEAKRYERE
jgi:uncharacterized DUF497 family protein